MRPILFLLAGGCFIGNAQNITNYTAKQQGNEVVVSYQLTGETGKAYTVSLFSSHNNFGSPLQFVEGDVGGKRVLPGSNKSIRWRALEELKNFDGDISFEIKAVPAQPLFSKITSSANKVKRGKEITLSWTGGNAQQRITLEIVRGSKRTQLGTMPNQGHFQYIVPKKAKTGKYTIQVGQGEELTLGDEFKIMAKYPLWMKAIPIAVVGGVIAFWPDPEDKFPEPPDLTGN